MAEQQKQKRPVMMGPYEKDLIELIRNIQRRLDRIESKLNIS